MAVMSCCSISWAIFIPVASAILIRQYISYFRWGRCKSKVSMKGKTVVITGANSGLGKTTALEMAKRGARVICACRDLELGQEAINDIRKSVSSGTLILHHLDLASFASINAFSDDILRIEPKIDVLINNAGVYGCPYSLTADGYEIHLGVNHLGHFLLTNRLSQRIKESAPSRIIIVSSSLYKYGSLDLEFLRKPESLKFNQKRGYSNSKLANILFGEILLKKLENYGVSVFNVCPGMVWTNLGRLVKIPFWKKIFLAPFAFFFIKTSFEGCQTILHCAIQEKVKPSKGHIYKNCKPIELSQKALDEELGDKLWEVSADITAERK